MLPLAKILPMVKIRQIGCNSFLGLVGPSCADCHLCRSTLSPFPDLPVCWPEPLLVAFRSSQRLACRRGAVFPAPTAPSERPPTVQSLGFTDWGHKGLAGPARPEKGLLCGFPSPWPWRSGLGLFPVTVQVRWGADSEMKAKTGRNVPGICPQEGWEGKNRPSQGGVGLCQHSSVKAPRVTPGLTHRVHCREGRKHHGEPRASQQKHVRKTLMVADLGDLRFTLDWMLAVHSRIKKWEPSVAGPDNGTYPWGGQKESA